MTYSRVRNKHTPTLINFWNFFQGLRSYSGLKRLKVYYISLHILGGYVYSFCQIYQMLRLFKGLRLPIQGPLLLDCILRTGMISKRYFYTWSSFCKEFITRKLASRCRRKCFKPTMLEKFKQGFILAAFLRSFSRSEQEFIINFK